MKYVRDWIVGEIYVGFKRIFCIHISAYLMKFYLQKPQVADMWTR